MADITRTELLHALPDHDPDEVLAVLALNHPNGLGHLSPDQRWREARMAAQTIDTWRRHNPDLVRRLAASHQQTKVRAIFGF